MRDGPDAEMLAAYLRRPCCGAETGSGVVAAWQEDKSLNIPASLQLSEGENVVWLTGELHADANIDGRIRVSVPQIQLGNQTFPVLQVVF